MPSARRRVAWVGATMIVIGCSTDPSYRGIAQGLPTGSTGISSEGLLVAYDMETTTADGHLRDFGPHGLHGDIATARSVEGRWGGARAFGRVSDRVTLPNSGLFDQPGPLTVAVWVRVNETGHHQHLLACDDSWALWITPADEYRLGDTRGTGFNSAVGALRPHTWQSVVAVWSGTRDDSLTTANAVVYVDGKRSPGAAGPVWRSGPLYPDDACYLGFESHQGNAAHQELPFYGDLDEVLVFSRAWTEAEVAAHAARASR